MNTQMINLIIAGAVPVVIASEAKLVGFIDSKGLSWIKPILAMALGAILLTAQHFFAALPATFWTGGIGAFLGLAGVGAREVLDQLFQQLGGKPTQASITSVPPKTSGRVSSWLMFQVSAIALFFVTLFCTLVPTGCNHITVQPGGPYSGDAYLYTADEEITSSYTLLGTFLNQELMNRAQFQQVDPKIKAYADYLRSHTSQWFSSVEQVRDAYAASQTAANKNALVTAVAVITTALDQAVVYLSGTKLAPPSALAHPAFLHAHMITSWDVQSQLATTDKSKDKVERIDPAFIIQLAIAAFQLAEQDLPVVENMFVSGAITIDQQNQLFAAYHSLETKADGQFSGPEWAVSP